MASLLPFSVPKLHIIRASSTSPSLTATATAPIPTPTTSLSIPETLNEKFGRKGIKFLESNNTPFVEMTVRNGSSMRLQIPNAHVTSYFPKVHWKDDGFEEVLYTVPVPDSPNSKGGVGLVLNDASDSSSKGSSLLSHSEWTVKASNSDAIDALQVELSCTAGTLDITYVISLFPQSLATAVKIQNTGRKAVTLTSAILSHLRSKKRNGTAIDGLRACNFCTHPPPPSPFELMSPSEAMRTEDPVWYTFEEPEQKPGSWKLQDGDVTNLQNKMSRIYAAPPKERLKGIYNTPPSKYETIDQGRKLFFRVIRMGYEDIYVSSPGSLSGKYGKEYFICTGPASLLVPVVVDPGEEWRGAQVIEHDNL